MNNNRKKIQMLVGIALLSALVIVFQVIGNHVVIGTVNITLALIPIAVGAILYGPLVGGFLGLVMGAIVIAAPGTIATFMPVNPWGTILICLTKTGLAGLVAGFIFKGFAKLAQKYEDKKMIFFTVGIIAATLIIPIINTGEFIIGASILFRSIFGAEDSFSDAFPKVVAAVLTTNFVIEFAISAVLSPAIVYVIKVITKTTDLGFSQDFSYFNSKQIATEA